MTVSVNATSTAVVNQTSGVTSITNGNLTIASGATALLAWLYFSGGTPTGIAVNWDAAGTPQAMTLITSVGSGGSSYASLWGLLSPRTGNLSLKATWTGTGFAAALNSIAFNGSGTDTIANAFPNAVNNAGTGTSATLTATSASGNINVAGLAAAGNVTALSATGSTLVWTNNSFVGSGGARAPGAASVAWSGTISSSVPWTIVATDVAVPLTRVTGVSATGAVGSFVGGGFTRASTATYIDSTGVMQLAASNTIRPRYVNGVFTGYLLESAATNLIPNSLTLPLG